VEGFATLDFTPHIARRSAATAVYHHPDGSAASTSAMLGHSGEAQLPAYVAKLSLPALDFSVIAALNELLPILDEPTLLRSAIREYSVPKRSVAKEEALA
jgi:hypothetical protein